MEEKSKNPVLNSTKEKPTYEELEQMLKTGEANFNKLREQANQMYKALQDQNMMQALKRLEYLFKVVELAHEFDSEFVDYCVKEIKTSMVLPEEPADAQAALEEK